MRLYSRLRIIDDTGLPKKGTHSVGVKRQYCGQVGKTANCQVAVSLSVASNTASLPVAYRLFLPEDWAHDKDRRAKVGVPDDVTFKTKGEIALEQIDAARAADITQGVIVADAGYGNSTPWRTKLTERGLSYIVGVLSNVSVWPPGTAPLPPTGKGRRPNTRLRRDENHQPVWAKELAQALDQEQWQTVTWREGSNAPLSSRFAVVRVRPANGDCKRSQARDVEWLLIEWPENEDEPTKYWLSTLPEDTKIEDLVDIAKLRWRIERDYQDLKQEIGLGHYEGRGWRGFHHHAALAIVAYGFLICEAGAFSPLARETGGSIHSSPSGRCRYQPQGPQIPAGFRPRGAAATV